MVTPEARTQQLAVILSSGECGLMNLALIFKEGRNLERREAWLC